MFWAELYKNSTFPNNENIFFLSGTLASTHKTHLFERNIVWGEYRHEKRRLTDEAKIITLQKVMPLKCKFLWFGLDLDNETFIMYRKQFKLYANMYHLPIASVSESLCYVFYYNRRGHHYNRRGLCDIVKHIRIFIRFHHVKKLFSWVNITCPFII